MKQSILLFLFCAFLQNKLTAQTTPVTDSIAANTADVQSIDAIIGALYNVISGDAGVPRNWNRMRSLFLPEAKMVATAVRPNGEQVKRVMTVEDYIRLNGPVLEKNGFFEKEIHRQQEVFGHIAHCFSTYASIITPPGSAEPINMRGINSIQLYYDGKRWWILSVFWQGETKEMPIPREYLNQ